MRSDLNPEPPSLRAQAGGPPGGYGSAPGGASGGSHGVPPDGATPPRSPAFHIRSAPDSSGPSVEIKKQATSWLIVSAVSFLLSSGVNCFGLIGAILCFLAMQAADSGHVLDAESKLKWGKIITVTGVVMSLIGFVLLLLYYFVIDASA